MRRSAQGVSPVAVAAIVLLLLPFSQGRAQPNPSSESEWILLTVETASIPNRRPNGEHWDAAAEQRNGRTVCDAALLLGDFFTAGASRAVCRLLFTPVPPDATESSADPTLHIDLGNNSPPLVLPVWPNTSRPMWDWSAYINLADISRLGARIKIYDSDGEDALDPIDMIIVNVEELRHAASTTERITLRGESGARVQVIVSPLSRIAVQSVNLEVVAGPEPTEVQGVRVSVGSEVTIRARGTVTLGDPERFDPVSPDGSSDPRSRRYNLRAFPDAAFGSLVLYLGQDDTTRMRLEVGSSRTFCAEQSGTMLLLPNDRSTRSNSGAWDVTVEVTPPGPEGCQAGE